MTHTYLLKLIKIATIKKELLHVKEDANSFLSFFTETGESYDIEYAILVTRTIGSLLDNIKAWYECALGGVDLDCKTNNTGGTSDEH